MGPSLQERNELDEVRSTNETYRKRMYRQGAAVGRGDYSPQTSLTRSRDA